MVVGSVVMVVTYQIVAVRNHNDPTQLSFTFQKDSWRTNGYAQVRLVRYHSRIVISRLIGLLFLLRSFPLAMR